jgi:hypothetical protein
MVSKLANNADLMLPLLGPLGVGISLGINLLSMGVRYYNG